MTETSVTAPGRRDAAYAVCLFAVLAIGVLGVLLLNTSMQQQARLSATVHQRIASLQEQAQQLQAKVDRQGDPALLAARARALHLHPVKRVHYLAATPDRGTGRARVSASRPAAGRGRAG